MPKVYKPRETHKELFVKLNEDYDNGVHLVLVNDTGEIVANILSLKKDGRISFGFLTREQAEEACIVITSTGRIAEGK